MLHAHANHAGPAFGLGLPGTSHVGRPPLVARGMSLRGSGGNPPARGFRKAKTHLAPRRPAKKAGQRAATGRPPPGAAPALAPGAMIAPHRRGSGRGPTGPPESCLRTCRADGFAPLRGAVTEAAPKAMIAPSARQPDGRNPWVVGIAVTYSQGTVSGGVNNRRNGDVQRLPEPSRRRTGLRQRRLRRHRPTGTRCRRAGARGRWTGLDGGTRAS